MKRATVMTGDVCPMCEQQLDDNFTFPSACTHNGITWFRVDAIPFNVLCEIQERHFPDYDIDKINSSSSESSCILREMTLEEENELFSSLRGTDLLERTPSEVEEDERNFEKGKEEALRIAAEVSYREKQAKEREILNEDKMIAEFEAEVMAETKAENEARAEIQEEIEAEIEAEMYMLSYSIT